MKWGPHDGISLDFGELTPIFWSLVFVGGLLIVTVVGISCVSCYLCTKSKLHRRHQCRPSSDVGHHEDTEVATFLSRPPPTNPDYTPTPHTLRTSALSYHSPYHNLRQNSPVESSTLLPPSDSAPPSYAEVVKISSPFKQESLITIPATLGTVPSSYRSRTGREAVEVVEPSAPYPNLYYHIE